MRKGTLDSRDWTTMAMTRGRINDAPLFIDDSPYMTLVEIRAKCRRLKQRVGLKMVVIDYLQLMTSGKRVESRQQEVSEFSRALKLLAKELQVPVIALSQLNRGPEQRADKKPAMSDLRESGSIEQDADMVILLHREAAYEKDSPRAGEADLIVAKHRNGPTDTITVAFQGTSRGSPTWRRGTSGSCRFRAEVTVSSGRWQALGSLVSSATPLPGRARAPRTFSRAPTNGQPLTTVPNGSPR